MLQVGFVLGEQAVDPALGQQLLNMTLKGFFLIAALLYVVFAFVAYRQVLVMRKTVITPFSGMTQLIGTIHLVMAIVVFVAFFILL